jgi:diadenosine tetraphosphate (Ap4A) HIT family hydrolase
MTACGLCQCEGEDVLWHDDLVRIVLIGNADQPGFCRVILQRHAREMTDLDELERQRVMAAVFATEAALRAVLAPDKMNLLSLGNQVPHVHWHVVPRWRDDATWPDAIWAAPRRPAPRRVLDAEVRDRLVTELARRMR